MKILVISDGKRGHLHQSEGLVENLPYKDKIKLDVRLSKNYYVFLCIFAFIYRVIKFSENFVFFLLRKTSLQSFKEISSLKPELIISTGSLTHPINYFLSQLTGAKSTICMRPTFLPISFFDLVIIPKHDFVKKHNDKIIRTYLALSNISPETINSAVEDLKIKIRYSQDSKFIGLLIGGTSAASFITTDIIQNIIAELLKLCDNFGYYLLVTTSRRTPREIEKYLKEKLSTDKRCSYLLLAGESSENPVPGIIGISEVVFVTDDSVSMASEIISAGKFVIVLKIGKKKRWSKFDKFFQNLADDNYIKYIKPLDIGLLFNKSIEDEKNKLKVLSGETENAAKEIKRRLFEN